MAGLCTQYARERMYPGQGFAPDREEYEAGALFFLTVLQVMLDRERRAVPFDPLKDFQVPLLRGNGGNMSAGRSTAASWPPSGRSTSMR